MKNNGTLLPRVGYHITRCLLYGVQWYGLFMHFCDLNHEVTRMQQREIQ